MCADFAIWKLSLILIDMLDREDVAAGGAEKSEICAFSTLSPHKKYCSTWRQIEGSSLARLRVSRHRAGAVVLARNAKICQLTDSS